MKGLGLFFVAACMIMAVSCSREETTAENALTRSSSVNDSTENKGGIQVDTIWEEPVTMGF
ncbi:MAG: hypothetical protein J5932_03080 [Prevotella sp.]|nr:hypothetical protein [Prevotella sp.]MBP3843995.1 hypothetical protein [Prevotella sp.]